MKTPKSFLFVVILNVVLSIWYFSLLCDPSTSLSKYCRKIILLSLVHNTWDDHLMSLANNLTVLMTKRICPTTLPCAIYPWVYLSMMKLCCTLTATGCFWQDKTSLIHLNNLLFVSYALNVLITYISASGDGRYQMPRKI